MSDYDLVIIGGGPGGYAAALYGANAGLSVALVERERPGGTCLFRGCIPSKCLLESAHVRRTVAGAEAFGIGGVEIPPVNFSGIQARKQQIVDNLASDLASLLGSRRVEVIEGSGKLIAPGQVKLDDGQTLSGRTTILAAGSVPIALAELPPDEARILNSDQLLAAEKLPSKVIVVGGGVVGLEFASMLTDLGVAVTVVEAGERVLPGIDVDIAKMLVTALKERRVEFVTNFAVERYNAGKSGIRLTAGDKAVEAEIAISAMGRRPAVDGLLGEESLVELSPDKAVRVDEVMRTSAAGVYAIGDVVATPQLAHVAYAEAILAVRHSLSENPTPIDYDRVPWCIYTHPEIAHVGLTEHAAMARGHEIEVRREVLGGNGRARTIGDDGGLVKVVAKKHDRIGEGEILGVHMIGPMVTEQIAAPYLALNWDAAPNDLAQMVFPHPTVSEALGETLMSLSGRGLHLV